LYSLPNGLDNARLLPVLMFFHVPLAAPRPFEFSIQVPQAFEELVRVRRMAQKEQWTRSARNSRPSPLGEAEKQAIVIACDSFIRDVLKPRFLREIRPTNFNYVIDIHGAWAGGRYRFMQRYRSGMDHNRGDEFDAPFARIDRVGRNRFDIQWMRHTGRWWRLYSGVTLAEALRLLETDEILYPG